MKAIDVHNHIVPSEFPSGASFSTVAKWPYMCHRGDGKASIMIGGKEFRALDNRSWGLQRRIADTDLDGIDMQVISPMPELLSYWFKPEHALTIARHVNRAISDMVTTTPDRFLGCGLVPLPEPGITANELASLRSEYNFVGIEIDCNIGGRPHDDQHANEPNDDRRPAVHAYLLAKQRP